MDSNPELSGFALRHCHGATARFQGESSEIFIIRNLLYKTVVNFSKRWSQLPSGLHTSCMLSLFRFLPFHFTLLIWHKDLFSDLYLHFYYSCVLRFVSKSQPQTTQVESNPKLPGLVLRHCHWATARFRGKCWEILIRRNLLYKTFLKGGRIVRVAAPCSPALG